MHELLDLIHGRGRKISRTGAERSWFQRTRARKSTETGEFASDRRILGADERWGTCTGHSLLDVLVEQLELYVLIGRNKDRIQGRHNLIQNQDFGRRKIWILKRKSRFGGNLWRWIRILRSRNEIREELGKSILKFSKSNFGV